MDKTFKQFLEEQNETTTCPECNGKGGKKYPDGDEMEWDSCRMCDGKKKVTKGKE